MSQRSPLGSGTSFGAGLGAFNPGDVQFHMYWGAYLYALGVPNSIAGRTGSIGSRRLPNESLNPLGNPEFSKLRTGDIASTAFNAAISTGTAPAVLAEADAQGLFVCVYPGTVGGGNAVWERMDEALPITQTIRDAHVIVVGESGHLAALAAVAIPPLAANGLNLGGVGDIASITCDYLDPGDGSGLQSALAAALAGGIPIDIRLRPMSLTLTAATVTAFGFSVPTGCRLIGAGPHLSSLTGYDGAAGGTTQTVVTLAAAARLEAVAVVSPAPAATSVGAQVGIVECSPGFQVYDCHVTLVAAVAALVTRGAQISGINCTSPNGRELVSDCRLFVDQLDTQPGGAQTSTAISFGGTLASFPSNVQDLEVRDVLIDEATGGFPGGSCPIGVSIVNVTGGRCINVEHVRSRQPRPSFLWAWVFTSVPAVIPVIRGPRWIECRVEATESETIGVDQDGYRVALGGSPNLAQGVLNAMIHDCSALFTPVGLPLAIERTGFRIVNSVAAPDGSDMRFFTLDNCRALGSHRGFIIDATGGTLGVIESVRMTSCLAPSPTSGGASVARGCIVRGSGLPAQTVRDVGIHNCDFTQAPAAGPGAGLEIEDLGVENTIAIGNHLRPIAGGVAIIDAGTGTEAAHNILV